MVTEPAEIGVYTIISTATIPSNTTGMNTAFMKSYSFTLTVQSDCVNTVILDKQIDNMSNWYSQPAVTQDVTFMDSIALMHPTLEYCG